MGGTCIRYPEAPARRLGRRKLLCCQVWSAMGRRWPFMCRPPIQTRTRSQNHRLLYQAGNLRRRRRTKTITGIAPPPLRRTRSPLQSDSPVGGLCSKCYRMRRHSRDYFGGNREAVLVRGAFQYRSCGAGEARLLHVHHRHPGNSDPDLLITVCSGCHARLHRLASIYSWIPELLAVQLQLAFGAEA